MKITREMVGAAHDVCLKKGDFVLSADLLERLYLAMYERSQEKAERDELLASEWTIAQGAAALAIEKCKNATGQRRTIEMYVSANQCAEDICTAIAAARKE